MNITDAPRTAIVLTRGLPGSGKTTWAKNWVQEDAEHRARCNRDDLRISLFGSYRLGRECEDAITEIQRRTVAVLLERGVSVAIDDMHLRPQYVYAWERVAKRFNAGVRIVEMPVDVELAIERDSKRDRMVGAVAIRQIADRYTRDGRYLPVQGPLPLHAACRLV